MPDAHDRCLRQAFTPTDSSWLNQVEAWFAKVQLDVIARADKLSGPFQLLRTGHHGRIARLIAAITCTLLTIGCHAQDRSGLAEILSFEAPNSGTLPVGWNVTPPGNVSLDDKVVHAGRWSLRIERQADMTTPISGIVTALPMDFTGMVIELRGFIRIEGVSEFVALWIREDGDSPALAFDSLQKRRINGTADWTEYSISVPLSADAKQLVIGFLLSGPGKAWVDDMRLLVDGKPIWEAPKTQHPTTVLDTDHEFGAGSKIAVSELSTVQIQNLATLGRVWGFLKYHHPRITSGQRHWDYDLFRVLPAVLDARDRANANTEIVKWISSLGGINECKVCANLNETELSLRPDLAWINDERRLGADLSRTLRAVYRNRPPDGKQFYVTLSRQAGNPEFVHEPGYGAVKLPDVGFQLLALYRFWNIIEYWFPYRDIIGEDWNGPLLASIPTVALAKTSEEYELAMMALIARVHDTHANLWSSVHLRPPVGQCRIPVSVRFIENRAVVAGRLDRNTELETGLHLGDVFETLAGIPIPQLIERWRPYYGASNEAVALRDIGDALTQGPCGDLRLRLRRGNENLEFRAKRLPNLGGGLVFHDVPGDAFRRLTGDVAYLKLSAVKAADVAEYIDRAIGTKGLILDLRNYPSEFVVYKLGPLLVHKDTPFARFTTGDLSNPGAFHFNLPVSLVPAKPHYSGQIVILADEVTQSQAEFTAMALRSAPNSCVIGNTTAGADGNTSQISLPGGLQSMISGIGVFYPDKRPTQRVGIIPDIEVKPTIAGIRAGQDELLEVALRRILGPDVPFAQIEKLAKAGND